MINRYGSHKEYIDWVKKDADERQKDVENAFRKSFAPFVEKRKVEVIIFLNVSVSQLANAIISTKVILKPLLAVVNIAGRTIERDIGLKNLDTYNPKITDDEARMIAGYIKPFLPNYLEITVLSNLDRIELIDKEIRKIKGQWERKIVENLNRISKNKFKKRQFTVLEDRFELDAATPLEGNIEVGIDIKRIEARRDIHKRCDEIVNKASKFKTAFPEGRFGAAIYYPFIDEHINVQKRLRSENIDAIVFASQNPDSIKNAVELLLFTLKVDKK
jgi:hypothetical protein